MMKERIRPVEFFFRGYSLETPRLILRRINKNDAQDMYEYSRLEEVTRYLLWKPFTSLDVSKAYIATLGKSYKNGKFFDFAVIVKDENKMIGTCGFTSVSEKDGAAEIGFVLNPAYHQKGYGYEAAVEVMRLGFMHFGFNRIEARCMNGNDASRALMSKLGMQYEGCARQKMFVKGVFRDIETCAILKCEFVEKYSDAAANIIKPSITSMLTGY